MASSSLVLGVVAFIFFIISFASGGATLVFSTPLAMVGTIIGIFALKSGKSGGFTLSLISLVLSGICLYALEFH